MRPGCVQFEASMAGTLPSSPMFVMWYVCSFQTRRVRTQLPEALPKIRIGS